ncbi:MAG: c-type cytochrome [Planctomycetales bacterium]|nr:c-type cytochrome [Planctomycetales bacterium]
MKRQTRWVSISVSASLLAVALASWARGQDSPQSELADLKTADGIDVALFASEPMITNPSAIDVDTQGRVWVAEIQFYRSQAKHPPADKIKVLEDTDGDGMADKVTVFAEGVFCPMSICVAGDQVYVATSPDLWVYEDKDGDLVADGPPRKLLSGFGGENHDHGAHSLVLGPDHKWWMSHGDRGFDVSGTDGSHVAFQWGAVLRGELDGSDLEIVARNFRNPYEVCVSSFGEGYLSDNDNDGNFSARICWILDGGDYGWFGGPPPKVPDTIPFGESWHFRGFIPGYVPATLVTGFGSPCGMCFYESEAFGPLLANAPLHADAGPREVRVYRHEEAGAGKQASSQVILTSRDDMYFRPDDVCAAPDGSLYVSDWYDGGVGGHAYNNPDQGRIFRLTPAGKTLERREKPGPYDSVVDALVALASPNLATQYLARVCLLDHADEAVAGLQSIVDSSDAANANLRARALWVLDRIGGDARSPVLAELDSNEPRWRALGVRILRQHGDEYAARIAAMVDDPSPEVWREVLLATPAMNDELAHGVLLKLAQHYQSDDRYLLETINVGAEGRREWLVEALRGEGALTPARIGLVEVLAPELALQMATDWLGDDSTAATDRQRLVTVLATIESPEAGRVLLDIIGDETADLSLRQRAAELLRVHLSGMWGTLASDDAVVSRIGAALANDALCAALLPVVAEARLDALAGHVVRIARNDALDVGVRRQALEVLAALGIAESATALHSNLDDEDTTIRQATLEALVALGDFGTLRRLVKEDELTAEERLALARSMLATHGGALALRKELEIGALPEDVVELVITEAAAHPDANIRELFVAYLPADKVPARLGDEVSVDTVLALDGDAERGRRIFNSGSAARCRDCHRIGDRGEHLGPDLDAIGTKYERAALLETILDPSKAIAPEFTPYVVETDSGHVYLGLVTSRSDQEVTLLDSERKTRTIPTEEITAIEPQTKSLMPDLVLRDVSAQDAADLLAFLLTLRSSGDGK